MSDSRRRYNAVTGKLRQLLPHLWAECESRMVNLSLMVSAIAKAKDLTQHALAAEMPLAAQDTSAAQRQRRWLMNERIEPKAIYQPVIESFIQAKRDSSIPLILDTTAAGVNCHLLTVAVGYQKRALPLSWRAGKGGRGHTQGEIQVELLEEVIHQLPSTADVIILGDGEFGHVELLEWLEESTYHYCLRLARDTQVLYEGQWRPLESFSPRSGESLWLEGVYLTRSKAFGPVNIYLTWDDSHQRLLPLVTNFSLPQEAAHWYHKRYWIEPLFGDIKGHGFDLQTSRLRDPARLSRLMLAVALAYLWLCFLGTVALITGQAKWVDRTDRRDRSLFTIGRQWLNRLLKLDQTILVGFCPYPFLNLSPPPTEFDFSPEPMFSVG